MLVWDMIILPSGCRVIGSTVLDVALVTAVCVVMATETAAQTCLLPVVWMSDVCVLATVLLVAWIWAVCCCRLY